MDSTHKGFTLEWHKWKTHPACTLIMRVNISTVPKGRRLKHIRNIKYWQSTEILYTGSCSELINVLYYLFWMCMCLLVVTKNKWEIADGLRRAFWAEVEHIEYMTYVWYVLHIPCANNTCKKGWSLLTISNIHVAYMGSYTCICSHLLRLLKASLLFFAKCMFFLFPLPKKDLFTWLSASNCMYT